MLTELSIVATIDGSVFVLADSAEMIYEANAGSFAAGALAERRLESAGLAVHTYADDAERFIGIVGREVRIVVT